MITLQRLNVVKIVDSDIKAEALIRQGFNIINDLESTINADDSTVEAQEKKTRKPRGGK